MKNNISKESPKMMLICSSEVLANYCLVTPNISERQVDLRMTSCLTPAVQVRSTFGG